MNDDVKRLKIITDKIDTLPTLPQVLNKLEKLLQNPRTSAAEVNKLISSDQVVTAKILKLVNSAFYGFPAQIATVTQAIVVLGFNAVKSLALSASVFDMFLDDGKKKQFDRAYFWEHCIGVAVITRELAKKVNYGEEEEAFVAGLLHDIGKVVLDHYAHDDLLKVIDHMQKNDKLFVESEKEILGVTHQEIGQWLATRWQMPLQLKDAIGYHHKPTYATNAPKLTAMVHVANILCQALRVGPVTISRLPQMNKEAWRILEIPEEDISKLLDNIDAGLLKAQVYFSLATKGTV